jgi:hypothetical protein
MPLHMRCSLPRIPPVYTRQVENISLCRDAPPVYMRRLDKIDLYSACTLCVYAADIDIYKVARMYTRKVYTRKRSMYSAWCVYTEGVYAAGINIDMVRVYAPCYNVDSCRVYTFRVYTPPCTC